MANVLTRREFKMMSEIFKAREQTLRKVMQSLVQRCYPKDKIYATKDYVYAVGDIPIGLIAHLDTVHPLPPREIFHDQEQRVIWSPQGIGADDRAGVYAIFSLIQEGFRPSIVLCTQEEVGGLGADSLIQDIPEPRGDLSFLIELDRCGHDDMVFYGCDNPDFEDYIESFGFKYQNGSFSDISVIAPAWGVAAVNLSIGYEDEHTYSERLYYGRMFDTINKVRKILEAEEISPHRFEYIHGRLEDYYGHWDPTLGMWLEEGKCDCCEAVFPRDKLKGIYEGGTFWYLCPDCLKKYARKCKKCGAWFLPWDPEDKDEKYCEFCTNKEKRA